MKQKAPLQHKPQSKSEQTSINIKNESASSELVHNDSTFNESAYNTTSNKPAFSGPAVMGRSPEEMVQMMGADAFIHMTTAPDVYEGWMKERGLDKDPVYRERHEMRMRMMHPERYSAKNNETVSRQEEHGDDDEQEREENADLLRSGGADDEDDQTALRLPADVQASPTSGGIGVSTAVEKGINSLGGGQQLSNTELSFFGPRLGADFSGVRVHNTDQAHSLADSINARAFTRGSDIVFAKGEYAPGSGEGKKLLAHELVHVVQGGNKSIQRQVVPNRQQAQVRERSGAIWVNRFPTSTSINDLTGTFRTNMQNFNNALIAANANISISATLRPRERAYLMHWAYRIVRENFNPQNVPAMNGVNIEWWHDNLQDSRAAAQAMVDGYGIVYRPALTSNHIRGRAIDMYITWNGTLIIRNATNQNISINSTPRTNANTVIQQVGATYGVIKHPNDFPHWSYNGR